MGTSVPTPSKSTHKPPASHSNRGDSSHRSGGDEAERNRLKAQLDAIRKKLYDPTARDVYNRIKRIEAKHK